MGNTNTAVQNQEHPSQAPQSPNQPLIDSEEDQPIMTPIATASSNFHIRAESISLEPHSSFSKVYSLVFIYDCLVPCNLKVYHFATESNNEFSCSDSKYPVPQTFELTEGIGQVFSENKIPIDTSISTPAELSFLDGRKVPLVLQIKSENVSETTMLSFRQTSNLYYPKLIQQRFEIDSKVFEIKEVYGKPTDAEEDNKYCAVCLVNKRDTVVIPCCHMCLCVTCGNFLRTQINKKCPICRTEAEALVAMSTEDF